MSSVCQHCKRSINLEDGVWVDESSQLIGSNLARYCWLPANNIGGQLHEVKDNDKA